MADPILVVTFDDTRFPLRRLSAQEMIKAKAWTGCQNRSEFFAAILNGNPEATLAGLILAKGRAGQPLTFADADVDLEDVEAHFEDEQGNEVEPVFELKPDGSLQLNADGDPIPVLDAQGEKQWRSVNGAVIPFGQTASSTTSTTPPQPGSSSVFASGA